MQNATTFGRQAEVYRAARPSYPDALFRWIAGQAPQQQVAWDVGTGSGQAAISLSEHFLHVHATDIDREQIAQAPQHASISFACAPAHASNLPSNSADAIAVATALHWFDHVRFWEEVRRVARQGAIFCAWTYHGAKTEPDVQRLLINPLIDILEPYWSDGNRLSWRGYAPEELKMPFDVISMPEFACDLQWQPMQIAAFLRSWSAHQKARLDGHTEVLAQIEREALGQLGNGLRRFVLPLHSMAARIC